MIPVLPELENREQWLAFLRRERPYAQVRKPSCRIDLQSTYLKITLLNELNASPLRFTLGSRSSVEPIWQLISGCHWSLAEMIKGLSASNFNTNARDNRISGWSPDMRGALLTIACWVIHAVSPAVAAPEPDLMEWLQREALARMPRIRLRQSPSRRTSAK